MSELQLQLLPSSQLQFPENDWHWLRQNSTFDPADPAFFLYGLVLQKPEKQEGSGLLAWHPKGGAVHFEASAVYKIPVLILKSSVTPVEAFLLYIQTTFNAMPPLEVEWVYVLKMLQEHFGYDLSNQGIPAPLARTLRASGFESHLSVLATRARFLFLNYDELKFLYQKRWDPSVFELLESLGREIRTAFLKAIASKNVSSGNAKEALQSTVYLVKKLGDHAALKLLTAQYKSAEDLQVALFHTAQPELARLSQTRIERLRALSAPPRTSVFGDPSFESDQIKITHTPRSIGDFDTFKNWIADPQTTEKLRQLLDIYL